MKYSFTIQEEIFIHRIGSIIFAKLSGYSWWPGMIQENYLVIVV